MNKLFKKYQEKRRLALNRIYKKDACLLACIGFSRKNDDNDSLIGMVNIIYKFLSGSRNRSDYKLRKFAMEKAIIADCDFPYGNIIEKAKSIYDFILN